MQRRLHPLAALGHGLVGKADDMHVDLAGRNHHLHVDRHRFDALKRNRANPRNHDVPLMRALPLPARSVDDRIQTKHSFSIRGDYIFDKPDWKFWKPLR